MSDTSSSFHRPARPSAPRTRRNQGALRAVCRAAIAVATASLLLACTAAPETARDGIEEPAEEPALGAQASTLSDSGAPEPDADLALHSFRCELGDGAQADAAAPVQSSAPATAPLFADVQFEEQNQRAVLWLSNAPTDALRGAPVESFELDRVRSASGSKYESHDPDLTFWNQGEEALLERPGFESRCEESPFEASWRKAALRGVTLRASGNEPGWILEVAPERFELLYQYGEERIALADPSYEVESGEPTRVVVPDAQTRVSYAYEQTECIDSMRGDRHDLEVTVIVDELTLRGCGRLL